MVIYIRKTSYTFQGVKLNKLTVVAVVAILMVLSFLAGLILLPTITSPNMSTYEVRAPLWENGKHWTYSFSTLEREPAIAEIVVAGNDDVNYNIGTSEEIEALRHAVLNYNPMLGRIGMKGLQVYEKGEPQNILLFPLKEGNTWTFSMFDVPEFDARVVSVYRTTLPQTGETVLVDIEASAPTGEKLLYTFDEKAGWLRSLLLLDVDGRTVLDMTLASYGSGFVGEVYFVRGVDLFSGEYKSIRGSPEIELYDTFMDQGHPNWGPFEMLIYYYDVDIGPESGGLLTLRDHISATPLRETFRPEDFGNRIGRIPSESGEWGVTVSLFGDARLDLRIAGGIEYVWMVI